MFKFFSYSICTIFFSISCFSQTIWKSDGSIIVDGQIKRESYAVRFLKQLKKSDRNWFQATIYKMPVDGYFGEDIFLPGTPLLRVSGMVPGEDYLYSLAKKNGFENAHPWRFKFPQNNGV